MSVYLNCNYLILQNRQRLINLLIQITLAHMDIQKQVYLKTIFDLRKDQKNTFDLIFKQLSSFLEQKKANQTKTNIIQTIMQQKLAFPNLKLNEKAKDYFKKYHKQLLQLYLLLEQNCEGPQLQILEMPTITDKIITQKSFERFKKHQQIAYIYIASSIFIPSLIKIIKPNHRKEESIQLNSAQSLSYALSFTHLHDIYLEEKLFLDQILTKPLRIIKNIPTLQDYNFYQNTPLTDVVDFNNCIFSSTLVERRQKGSLFNIQAFNCSKYIKFNKALKQRPFTNNSLLNIIERLSISSLLSIPISQNLPRSTPFCLTFSINKKHFLKLRQFFDKIPPQISPFSKHDAFSYAKGQQNKTLFYRFATESYWEHCPQCQLLDVYYLCNQSQVEWMSMPSSQYSKANKKIKFWSNQELDYFYSNQSNLVRGLQKKGEFVIIGAGHEYFWKVKQYRGIAVLLKWSLLLKQYNQFDKYIKIIRSNEKHTINYPHRRIMMQYISHQHMNLDSDILRKLVSFINNSVHREYQCFSKVFVTYQHQSIIKQKSLPSKYRICGVCCRQLLNLFASLKENIVCLWCLPDQLYPEDGSFKFELNYMLKPSILQNYLKNILLPKEREIPQINQMNVYEATFCQGSFVGNYELANCFGEPINIQEPLSNHIINCLDNLELYFFQKRSYFTTIQSVIKSYAFKKRKSQQEEAQIKSALNIWINCLSKQQKKSVCSQIFCHYNQKNYVLLSLNLLNQKQKT